MPVRLGPSALLPVPGREANQFAGRFRLVEMRRVPDDFVKFRKYLSLIVNQKFREAHHIHEQNMSDFEMKILSNLGGHPVMLPENKSIHNWASRRPSIAKLGKEDWLCGKTTSVERVSTASGLH